MKIKNKLFWMMKYCEENKIPPAQSWAWNKALNEYNKLEL